MSLYVERGLIRKTKRRFALPEWWDDASLVVAGIMVIMALGWVAIGFATSVRAAGDARVELVTEACETKVRSLSVL